MEWNPEVVRRVRGAMQDRARSQACLFKAFSSVMTREQAEALAREGIAEYGRIRAERDGRKLAPEDQDLFCDVAMELDRNRAKEHGIPCDIVERLGKGDPFCRVVLWKKKKD